MDAQKRAQADNVAEFMDKGPGLRWSTSSFVLARDRERHLVYLGGLGGMGVGTMWFNEADYMTNYDGWDSAPDAIGPPLDEYGFPDSMKVGTFADGSPLPHPMVDGGWREYEKRERR